MGNVDNIGIGNNDGGSPDVGRLARCSRRLAAKSADLKFYLAFYSREDAWRNSPNRAPILAFELTGEWPEMNFLEEPSRS